MKIVNNENNIDDNTENEQKMEEKKEIENEESLINLLEKRLQFILRSLTKLNLNNKNVSCLKKE